MSNDLNLCQFIGRLGKDPEVRYGADGGAMASISLAVGSAWKDKKSGEKQERTEWVRVMAYGKLAEIFAEYLKKGAQIHVSGRMQTRKWQDKEGKERYTTEIIADRMQMLGSKPANEERESPAPKQKAQDSEPFDDDIPF